MKALVTGATGFIGKSLCARLKAAGAFVRVSVRHPSGHLAADEVRVTGDIDQEPEWEPALAGIDVVFHLAGLAHIPHATPLRRFQSINVDGTNTIARVAAACGISRFVYLSSTKVNGDSSPPCGFRDSDPPAPSDAYARSKAAAEACVRNAGVPYTIVRAPLVYGAGVRANFLALLRAVDRGIPLPVGRVNNRRTLVYVMNLADAMILLATHQAAINETFFVADNDDVSTPELVRRIAAAMGKRPRIISFPVEGLRLIGSMFGKRKTIEKLVGDSFVDLKKLRQLGWNPPYTMTEGLALTAAWYQNRA